MVIRLPIPCSALHRLNEKPFRSDDLASAMPMATEHAQILLGTAGTASALVLDLEAEANRQILLFEGLDLAASRHRRALLRVGGAPAYRYMPKFRCDPMHRRTGRQAQRRSSCQARCPGLRSAAPATHLGRETGNALTFELDQSPGAGQPSDGPIPLPSTQLRKE